MTTTAIKITEVTFTKLRSGEWGIKGTDLTEGMEVMIVKRSGDTKLATVGKIIWTGKDGAALATVGEYLPPRKVVVTTSNGSSHNVTIGAPKAAAKTAPTFTGSRSTGAAKYQRAPQRRCEECGSTRGVHRAVDMSGIPGFACYRCDDGSLSFC